MHMITAWVALSIVIFIPYHFIYELVIKRREERDRKGKELGVIEVLPADRSVEESRSALETAIDG